MGQAATGSRSFIEIAPELESGLPAQPGTFQSIRLVTPNNFELNRTEEDDGELEPSQFMRPMIASTVRDNSPSLSILLTTFHSLRFLHHFHKGGMVTTPFTGGTKYAFTGASTGDDYGFTVYVSMDPVENFIRHTFKVAEIEIPITGTAALQMKCSGNLVNGQDYYLGAIDSVSGTYQFVPSIRGPVKFDTLGDVYVEVTNLTPFEYKAEISTIAPTFPGTATPIVVDGLTERGAFSNLQGSVKLPGTVTVLIGTPDVTGGTGFLKYIGTGTDLDGISVDIDGETIVVQEVLTDATLTLAANHVAGAAAVPIHIVDRDLGFFAENTDKVEICWQGDATDYANFSLNDRWVFTEAIPTVVPSFTSSDRFTMSHTNVYFREVGDPNWILFPGLEATLKASWPLEIDGDPALGSMYINGLDRTERLSYVLDPFKAVYRVNNKKFIEWHNSHQRIQAKIEVFGRQLGDGNREGHRITLNDGTVSSATRPIDSPQRINITSAVTGTTNSDGTVSPGLWEVFTSGTPFTEPVIIA